MTEGALRVRVHRDALSRGVPEMFWVCDDVSRWADNMSGGEAQMNVGLVRVNVGEAQICAFVAAMRLVSFVRCLSGDTGHQDPGVDSLCGCARGTSEVLLKPLLEPGSCANARSDRTRTPQSRHVGMRP